MRSFTQEPALYLGSAGAIVAALLVLLVSFGVPITPEQRAAINALVVLVVGVVSSAAIRQNVTPLVRSGGPSQPDGTPVA